MVRTTTAVDCASCGLTTGHYESGGQPRCEECGRYAERTDDYCERHDKRLTNLPPGYNGCLYCEREESKRQREQEMLARRADPNMHPMVDAPRR